VSEQKYSMNQITPPYHKKGQQSQRACMQNNNQKNQKTYHKTCNLQMKPINTIYTQTTQKKKKNSKQNLPTTNKISNWKIKINQNPIKLSQPKPSTKNLLNNPPFLKIT